jgi:pimeloyl-ACP methyl ester carboxylesterase
MAEPTTHTVETSGATIAYDVREPTEPPSDPTPLLLIGSPMDASGFATLAGHFADRTVVTYDPRGAMRSELTAGTDRSTPEEHADDLHRIIAELGDGPVELFASSGGAVNAMALVARHPGDVRTLIAHEPPLAAVLEDDEEARAAATAIAETYRREGFGPAMAKFIALTAHRGPLPASFATDPPPDPAAFGLPTEDDGSRDDPLVGLNIVTCTHYEPDFEALAAAPTRIVLAAGAGSTGELAHRGADGVAERLGTDPVAFPGDHGGFFGGEYGMQGEPEAFAAKLREVLAEA